MPVGSAPSQPAAAQTLPRLPAQMCVCCPRVYCGPLPQTTLCETSHTVCACVFLLKQLKRVDIRTGIGRGIRLGNGISLGERVIDRISRLNALDGLFKGRHEAQAGHSIDNRRWRQCWHNVGGDGWQQRSIGAQVGAGQVGRPAQSRDHIEWGGMARI